MVPFWTVRHGILKKTLRGCAVKCMARMLLFDVEEAGVSGR